MKDTRTITLSTPGSGTIVLVISTTTPAQPGMPSSNVSAGVPIGTTTGITSAPTNGSAGQYEIRWAARSLFFLMTQTRAFSDGGLSGVDLPAMTALARSVR